jgi:drug/metabolite transporter (DMT)-like permease
MALFNRYRTVYHLKMNKRVFGADLLLLLTAVVWGFGFVAQRSGMQYVGPFTFNGVRFLLGSLSLLPLIAFRNRKRSGSNNTSKLEPNRKTYFLSFLFLGTCLFIAVSLQQIGIMATTAGNAGFITGLYVIFTPIFGIFLGRKTGKFTWLGAILTFTGLYFLSFASQNNSAGSLGGINPGDIIVAISAVFWAFHVLIIDRMVQKIDPIVLSSGHFAVAGLYALIAAFLVEPLLSDWLKTSGQDFLSMGLFSWESFPSLINGLSSGAIPMSIAYNAVIPILYGGLVSVGIGYTLQLVAQKHAPPAHATIILSLEGCFAAVGGILLLSEPLGSRTLIGFVLMLTGMLISQWELIRGRAAFQNAAEKLLR